MGAQNEQSGESIKVLVSLKIGNSAGFVPAQIPEASRRGASEWWALPFERYGLEHATIEQNTDRPSNLSLSDRRLTQSQAIVAVVRGLLRGAVFSDLARAICLAGSKSVG